LGEVVRILSVPGFAICDKFAHLSLTSDYKGTILLEGTASEHFLSETVTSVYFLDHGGSSDKKIKPINQIAMEFWTLLLLLSLDGL
jgi:hypothetical protein